MVFVEAVWVGVGFDFAHCWVFGVWDLDVGSGDGGDCRMDGGGRDWLILGMVRRLL